MKETKCEVVFTGGHHTSAIPLIKILQEKGVNISFIGHKYASKTNKEVSSEYKELSSYRVNYIDLKAPKFYGVSGIKKYLDLTKSVFTSFKILKRLKPKVLFTFGGYLSVPPTLAAKLLGIKVVTHEQTASGGLAFKVVSRLSDTVFLTFEDSNCKSDKYVVTGIPIRQEIKNITPEASGSLFKPNVMYVQGGKQGSHVLNSFIFENIKYFDDNFKVYHQTSRHSEYKDYEKALKLKKQYKNYFPFDFIYGKEYAGILKEADFLLSRSGAHVVYEMCYLKKPTIFVPIPWSSNNEQFKNAQKASDFIPCVVLEQSDLKLSGFKSSLDLLKKKYKDSNKLKDVISDAEMKIVDYLMMYYI